jgi:hypothetical protein
MQVSSFVLTGRSGAVDRGLAGASASGDPSWDAAVADAPRGNGAAHPQRRYPTQFD